VPAHARIKVEREVDNLRFRLEKELRDGALDLQRLKNEIEENRKDLLPALTNARRFLARAINDWEMVIKRNKMFPAIMVLLIAFSIGTSINLNLKGAIFEERGRGSQPVETSRRPISVEDRAQAHRMYEDGIKFNQNGDYPSAVIRLEQAVNLNPEFADAYGALGFSLHRVNNYQGAITAWNKAIALGNKNFETYYGLGMVHVDQRNWRLAENSFVAALSLRVVRAAWKEEYTKAFYNLGRAIVEIGEGESEIETLEIRLRSRVTEEDQFRLAIEEDQFRLAILNLWLGNDKEVLSGFNQLKEMKSELANELQKLVREHKRELFRKGVIDILRKQMAVIRPSA
jgi:tetratricopeptide (TPR) repeat protein